MIFQFQAQREITSLARSRLTNATDTLPLKCFINYYETARKPNDNFVIYHVIIKKLGIVSLRKKVLMLSWKNFGTFDEVLMNIPYDLLLMDIHF